jgi:regulator of RNase E activity RraA
LPTPGFAVFRLTDRPEPSRLASVAMLPTPFISDSLGRLPGAVGLRPFYHGTRMVGPAFTVKTRPGDNLMIHLALDQAQEGDVIVVDGGGDETNALVGEIMLLWAMKRRLGGFVIDGAIRDVDAYAKGAFPCFARSVNHRGPYKDGPGMINVPVVIAGMVVLPGDIIVGDSDGLVAFSPVHLDTVLRLSAAKIAQEQQDRSNIEAGHYDRPWLEELLRKHQVH